VVLALEARRFGRKQVLLRPDQIKFNGIAALLNVFAAETSTLPLAASVLPVVGNMPPWRSALQERVISFSPDPHLRSARAVAQYQINVGGEFAGTLSDFMFDDGSWEIGTVGVEQVIEQKKVQFHYPASERSSASPGQPSAFSYVICNRSNLPRNRCFLLSRPNFALDFCKPIARFDDHPAVERQ
jgi:hypothetical protein